MCTRWTVTEVGRERDGNGVVQNLCYLGSESDIKGFRPSIMGIPEPEKHKPTFRGAAGNGWEEVAGLARRGRRPLRPGR